jgi:hypothetical protein
MDDTTSIAAHDAADVLFAENRAVFGDDLGPYSGHVHRVIGLVSLLVDIPPELARPLGVAAFFHDAAIWFDETWDYLPRSVERAEAELTDAEGEHRELVAAMINEHHRFRTAHHDAPIVEAFRRADLGDISFGRIRPAGITRGDYLALTATYPAKGLRPMLLRALGRGLKENPFRPASMLKL